MAQKQYKLKALNVHIGNRLFKKEEGIIFDTVKFPKDEVEAAFAGEFLEEVKGKSNTGSDEAKAKAKAKAEAEAKAQKEAEEKEAALKAEDEAKAKAEAEAKVTATNKK